jgi:hypothetical protein
MTDVAAGPQRPILLTSPRGRRTYKPFGGGRETVRLPDRTRQAERLTSRFQALLQALEASRVTIQTSLPAADPELVLVFETRGGVADVLSAARKAGIQLLLEVEDEFDPDEDFQKDAKKPALVPGFLHVALTNLTAMRELLRLWGMWTSGEPLPRGLGGMGSGLASLFGHLSDVREWGPRDRIRATGLAELIAERIDQGIGEVPVEVELWFYESAERRQTAETAVRATVAAAGGRVTQTASYETFGYHGIAAVLPTAALTPLLEQGADAIQLLRGRDIFFVRAGGQSVLPPEDVQTGAQAAPEEPRPSGDPTVVLLDGLPVANHTVLDGRVSVFDPDGLDDGTYEVRLRRHGTEMASLIIWGDLAAQESSLSRPLLARPILHPDPRTLTNSEAIPDGTLIPDLMVRVIRELRGDGEGEGHAPTIRIVNLSVCDPHASFDTIPSAWARALDWLAEQYGLLVVVSAGNHLGLEVDTPRAGFQAASPMERRRLTLQALTRDALSRRLLTPAESINALTVGALHADEAGTYAPGPRVDPLGDAPIPSPISPMGRGFRRSVKPDVHAHGGRQLYNIDLTTSPKTTRLLVSGGSLPPGLRTACPTDADPTRGEVHVRGTSGAAALTSRRAAQLLEVVENIRVTVPGFEDRHLAAALKALVVHGSEWPDQKLLGGTMSDVSVDRYFGYGWTARNHSLGCPSNGVTLLAVGDLGAREEEDIALPLPPGLSGMVGLLRVTATLAWLSPINWRHRQYRRAKLGFRRPVGPLAPVVTSTQVGAQKGQRGTVQHQVFEGTGAVPIGPSDDEMLTVQCMEQAGGLGGRRIPYAVAISLEVAASLGVDVYAEVASRIRPAVVVAPRT